MVLDERTPTKTKRQDGSGCNFCILLPKHENASKYKYPTGAKEQIQMETLCKCFISFSTSGSSMLSYVIPCPIIATLPCVPWQPFSKVCGLASVDLGELLPSWISWTDVGKSHLFLGGSNSHRTIGSMYSIFTRTILYFPNIQLLEFYDKSRSIYIIRWTLWDSFWISTQFSRFATLWLNDNLLVSRLPPKIPNAEEDEPMVGANRVCWLQVILIIRFTFLTEVRANHRHACWYCLMMFDV